MRITPLGDNALVLELGTQVDEPTHFQVQAAARLLSAPLLAGVTEIVPSFTTITILYDPVALAEAGDAPQHLISKLCLAIRSRLDELPSTVEAKPGPIVEIPVCYGGEFGPDLAEVAERKKLTAAEVARHHSEGLYLVYLIGFSPGFPYLGGLPQCLAMPRRSTPRSSVPPGSVGIANLQSCIYPMATPGGWNLIGRTPLKLFRPLADQPTLLRASDQVKFRAITPDEFANWKHET